MEPSPGDLLYSHSYLGNYNGERNEMGLYQGINIGEINMMGL